MTTKFVIFILLELVLFYFLFGNYLVRKILPTRRRRSLIFRDYQHHLRRILRLDHDLLDENQQSALAGLVEEAARCRVEALDAAADAETLDARLHEIDQRSSELLKYRESPWNWLRESLEVAVVALAIAFGFRALFLQPFKIPTGSMEPTLYGIHFQPIENLEMPNSVQRVVDYLHFSRRYVDETVKRTGYLRDLGEARSFPLFPVSNVVIAGLTYRLPGDLDALKKMNGKLGNFLDDLSRYAIATERLGLSVDKPQPPMFEAGDTLAEGCMITGDHVFVNRFWLNFTGLKRGDIVVFLTDGIRDQFGQPLRGRYYIKRLVGLPGDTLLIKDDGKLYVKEPGSSDFQVVDGSVAPAFDRIYSGRGGYHGYVRNLAHSKYLSEPFTIGEDQYLMLGDNSAHSQDSRFWGTVPRRNIVGRASLVWWPLSRRWGVIDSVEPEDYETGARSPLW
jgi:signal peptidase I